MKMTKIEFATVLFLSIFSVTAFAAYDNPWLADWTSKTGYTSQFWGLNAVSGVEPSQPLAADIYSINSYGTSTATWVNDQTSGFVSWAETLMGSHPSWATGVYGGMANWAAFDVSANVSTGTDTSNNLLIVVQYDWYAYSGADVWASIEGATEITPASYYDYQIGESGSGNVWVRSTQVFELTNTGSIDVLFSGTGFATAIDSFSITTVIGDASELVPAEMLIPEPATLGILGFGSIAALFRRKK